MCLFSAIPLPLIVPIANYDDDDDDDDDDGEGLSTLSKPKSGCLSSEGLTEKVSLQQLFEFFQSFCHSNVRRQLIPFLGSLEPETSASSF